MYFYTIIPQAKLPRNLAFGYTYCSEKILQRGDLVKIEFRRQTVLGLILRQADVTSATPGLKEIQSQEGSLPSYLVDLVEWLGAYYLTSPSFVWQMISPSLPLRPRPTKFEPAHGLGVDYLKLKVTALALPLIKKILDQREPRIDQINSLNLSTAARFITYIKSIEQTKKRGQSAILITPTVEQLAVLVKYFPPDWGNSVLIVSGDLYTNKNKYWNTWQKILTSQEPLVILGTRSAIFAPLPNLGLIIIDHAQSIDHKQYDQNPRYDARHVAEKISELTGCQLKLFCEGLYF